MDKLFFKLDLIFKFVKKCVVKVFKLIVDDVLLMEEQIYEVCVCIKKLWVLLQFYCFVCSKFVLCLVDYLICNLVCVFLLAWDVYVQYVMLEWMMWVFNEDNQNNLQLLLDYYCIYVVQEDVILVVVDVWEGFDELLYIWCQKIKFKVMLNFVDGFNYVYKYVCKLVYDVELLDDDELYYECCKWVKYYLYQLQMLVKDKCLKDKIYICLLEKLGICLGDFYDCCVLEWLLNWLLEDDV